MPHRPLFVTASPFLNALTLPFITKSTPLVVDAVDSGKSGQQAAPRPSDLRNRQTADRRLIEMAVNRSNPEASADRVTQTLHAQQAEKQLQSAKLYMSKYSELEWLADTGVSATNEGLIFKPKEENSYSRRLEKNAFFPELERSLHSLHCLDLIADDSEEAYEAFTCRQQSNVLSLDNYHTLAARWKRLTEDHPDLSPEEVLEAARVALVLGDMGKSPVARELMLDLDIKDPDHDDFYARVIAHPLACARLPSFCQLNLAQKQLLKTTAGLAHFGHITHCEGSPVAMYGALKRSDITSREPLKFDFAIMVHIFDVAGALGHRENQGSLTYSDETFAAIEDTISSCRQLATGDEATACRSYLIARARRIGLSGETSLDLALARIAAMLRLFTPEQGTALQTAFAKLDEFNQKMALAYLTPKGAAQFPRTPTYVPAFLVNLLNNHSLGATLAARLEEAVCSGLPFINATFNCYLQALAEQKIDETIPLNFNLVAGGAATRRPEFLRENRLHIDLDSGSVSAPNRLQSLPMEIRRAIVAYAVGSLEKGKIDKNNNTTFQSISMLNRIWYGIASEMDNIQFLKASQLYHRGLTPRKFSYGYCDGNSDYTFFDQAGATFDLNKLVPLADLLAEEQQQNLIRLLTTQTADSHAYAGAEKLPPKEDLRANVVKIMPFIEKFSPASRELLKTNATRLIKESFYYDETGQSYSNDDSQYIRAIQFPDE